MKRWVASRAEADDLRISIAEAEDGLREARDERRELLALRSARREALEVKSRELELRLVEINTCKRAKKAVVQGDAIFAPEDLDALLGLHNRVAVLERRLRRRKAEVEAVGARCRTTTVEDAEARAEAYREQCVALRAAQNVAVAFEAPQKEVRKVVSRAPEGALEAMMARHEAEEAMLAAPPPRKPRKAMPSATAVRTTAMARAARTRAVAKRRQDREVNEMLILEKQRSDELARLRKALKKHKTATKADERRSRRQQELDDDFDRLLQMQGGYDDDAAAEKKPQEPHVRATVELWPTSAAVDVLDLHARLKHPPPGPRFDGPLRRFVIDAYEYIADHLVLGCLVRESDLPEVKRAILDAYPNEVAAVDYAVDDDVDAADDAMMNAPEGDFIIIPDDNINDNDGDGDPPATRGKAAREEAFREEEATAAPEDSYYPLLLEIVAAKKDVSPRLVGTALQSHEVRGVSGWGEECGLLSGGGGGAKEPPPTLVLEARVAAGAEPAEVVREVRNLFFSTLGALRMVAYVGLHAGPFPANRVPLTASVVDLNDASDIASHKTQPDDAAIADGTQKRAAPPEEEVLTEDDAAMMMGGDGKDEDGPPVVKGGVPAPPRGGNSPAPDEKAAPGKVEDQPPHKGEPVTFNIKFKSGADAHGIAAQVSTLCGAANVTWDLTKFTLNGDSRLLATAHIRAPATRENTYHSLRRALISASDDVVVTFVDYAYDWDTPDADDPAMSVLDASEVAKAIEDVRRAAHGLSGSTTSKKGLLLAQHKYGSSMGNFAHVVAAMEAKEIPASCHDALLQAGVHDASDLAHFDVDAFCDDQCGLVSPEDREALLALKMEVEAQERLSNIAELKIVDDDDDDPVFPTSMVAKLMTEEEVTKKAPQPAPAPAPAMEPKSPRRPPWDLPAAVVAFAVKLQARTRGSRERARKELEERRHSKEVHFQQAPIPVGTTVLYRPPDHNSNRGRAGGGGGVVVVEARVVRVNEEDALYDVAYSRGGAAAAPHAADSEDERVEMDVPRRRLHLQGQYQAEPQVHLVVDAVNEARADDVMEATITEVVDLETCTVRFSEKGNFAKVARCRLWTPYVGDFDPEALKTGLRCSALRRGGPDGNTYEYARCVVDACRPDGRYDVHFAVAGDDDFAEERGLERSRIRLLNQSSRARPGDAVYAVVGGTLTKAKLVSATAAGGTLVEPGGLVDNCFALECGKYDTLAPGTRVSSRYSDTPQFFEGLVQAARDGLHEIAYDDGEFEVAVSRRRLRVLSSSPQTGLRRRRLDVGDEVDVVLPPLQTTRVATVVATTPTTCDVRLDDEPKVVHTVALGNVYSLVDDEDDAAAADRLESTRVVAPSALLPVGVRVWKRTGRSFDTAATVVSASSSSSSETYAVRLDDGTTETDVPRRRLRLPTETSMRKLKTGATYDAVCEATARQGDDEAAAAAAAPVLPCTLVRFLEGDRCEVRFDDQGGEEASPTVVAMADVYGEFGDAPLEQGTAVQARYRGTTHFYDGKIAKLDSDGTYEVLYDDGDREVAVSRRRLRFPNQVQPLHVPPGTLVDAVGRSGDCKAAVLIREDFTALFQKKSNNAPSKKTYIVVFVDDPQRTEHAVDANGVFAAWIDATDQAADEVGNKAAVAAAIVQATGKVLPPKATAMRAVEDSSEPPAPAPKIIDDDNYDEVAPRPSEEEEKGALPAPTEKKAPSPRSVADDAAPEHDQPAAAAEEEEEEGEEEEEEEEEELGGTIVATEEDTDEDRRSYAEQLDAEEEANVPFALAGDDSDDDHHHHRHHPPWMVHAASDDARSTPEDAPSVEDPISDVDPVADAAAEKAGELIFAKAQQAAAEKVNADARITTTTTEPLAAEDTAAAADEEEENLLAELHTEGGGHTSGLPLALLSGDDGDDDPPWHQSASETASGEALNLDASSDDESHRLFDPATPASSNHDAGAGDHSDSDLF